MPRPALRELRAFSRPARAKALASAVHNGTAQEDLMNTRNLKTSMIVLAAVSLMGLALNKLPSDPAPTFRLALFRTTF